MLALLDYLKNSRPQSEKLLVFIKASAPYTDYADSNSFHTIVKKYLEAAKIEYKSSKHHGLHSMRYPNLYKIQTFFSKCLILSDMA
jgi:hypothetical protein